MAAAGEATEPLKYQTWVLKVFIHCEGCKRTVKKALQSIDGVYKTNVDLQHHKVTVIGNVLAETLIKKLLKTGKHAELWPEKNNSIPKKNKSEEESVPEKPNIKSNAESPKIKQNDAGVKKGKCKTEHGNGGLEEMEVKNSNVGGGGAACVMSYSTVQPSVSHCGASYTFPSMIPQSFIVEDENASVCIVM
ncbi:hypothetical protein J5N97_002070 [Dioscorea zingiberensis]|nr:hypothetical protein J5N97_002070 [Dioscorea zingiberensis]